jgi:hypothetical protein
MDSFTGSTVTVGIVAFALVGGFITLGVRYLEARSRREDDATRLQQALSEPLARDPALASSSILPVVSVPRRGPACVEVTGRVPSREAGTAAIRAIELEAKLLGRRIRIVDRLEVVDAMRRPA